MRHYVEAAVVIAVFIISLINGALLPSTVKARVISSTKQLLSPLSSLFKSNPIKAYISLPVIILYNNLRVAVVNTVLGFTIVIPLAITWFNGYRIGSLATYGNVVRNIILLVPHGVIELTAILYSAILGVRVGFECLRKLILKGGDPLEEFKHALSQLKYVFILLVIAALIESYITPLIYFTYKLFTGG